MFDREEVARSVSRRRVLRGLGAIALVGVIGPGSAAAQGAPEEFPGSETGKRNSKKGRENAVEKSGGTANPPGTGDSDGGPGNPST